MSTDRMEGPEFQAFHMTLRAINTVVAGVNDDDLQRFIAACEHADAIGPYVDPTAWMRGHESLHALSRSAQALQAHKKVLRELAPDLAAIPSDT